VLGDGAAGAAFTVGGGVIELAAAPPTPLEGSLERLEKLVSPWTGVVRDVHEVLAARDDARLPRLAAVLADAKPLLGFRPGHLEESSGGSADMRLRARAAAIGEAAERYAASFVPDDEVVSATARELGAEAVEPARFSLFAPEQHRLEGFPFVEFTDGTRVRWTRGFTLPEGAPAWLPAQLVYLSWNGFPSDDAPIGYATSSGLACGPTLEESVLAGLLELVERDAFALVWAHRLSLPLLDWRSEPELLAWEARYLEPAGASHDVVDLSAFLGIPVALAVVHGSGDGDPATAVGAGSAVTAREAWKKALAEAYSVRSWARTLLATDPDPRFTSSRSEVASFADHVRFHALAQHAESCAFLTRSPARRRVGDVEAVRGATVLDRIAAVCDRLALQGCGAFAVDVTTADLLEAGLRVTKVVVPELCPLDVRHDARFLGGSRLRTLPHALGLTAHPLRWGDVSSDPHPFP